MFTWKSSSTLSTDILNNNTASGQLGNGRKSENLNIYISTWANRY